MLRSAKVYCVACTLLSILFYLPVNASVMVISPHPDDDVIIASGVVCRALERGESVHVVYMTNGDYGSIEQGYARQAEAVNAQAYLGMNEDDLIFLGYPDVYLGDVYEDYPEVDAVFTSPHGQSTTYGNRGLGRSDYHTYHFGSPAQYNGYNIVLDLKTIINAFRPDHIFTTCGNDSDDHERTYLFMSMALSDLFSELPDYNPTVHKTTVWPGQPSWPNALDPFVYFSEIPEFSSTGLIWSERESLDVPISMQSTFYPGNFKHLAIDAHISQNGSFGYLGRFIHKDEFFWVEQLRGTNQPPVVNAGFDQTVDEGIIVQLNGSGSFDHNGGALNYQWQQVGGTLVVLSSTSTANPSFTATSGLIHDEILTFELVVSDGELNTVPDSVNVLIRSSIEQPTYTRVASLASAITASSVHSSSSVLNAVDGCIAGYPEDPSCEWTTHGEKEGAWIQLDWDNPVTIGRITFYDRPNINDQITQGTLSFSDGSAINIGPLENSSRAVEYTFSPREITSVRLTVNEVSSRTYNVGLAEIEVFEISGVGINHVPIAVVGSDQTVVEGAWVQLNGSSSYDPDGGPLTYQWIQTGGISIELSDATVSNPTFTAPTDLLADEIISFQLVVSDADNDSNPASMAVTVLVSAPANRAPIAAVGENQTVAEGDLVQLDGSGSYDPDGDLITYLWTQTAGISVELSDETLENPTLYSPTGLTSDEAPTFELVVNDGELDSEPDSVTVTVQMSPDEGINIAPQATASASSEANINQSAAKAIDGCIDGYPGDSTCEWVADYRAVKVGSWLELTWSSARVIDRIVFYDRPNLNDRITGLTITMSDGSSFTVGPLNNDGSASEYSFSPVEITSLRMIIDSLRGNVGLSEIEVFESPDVNHFPQADAGNDQSVGEGATVVLDGSLSRDIDGDELFYDWSQSSGMAVVLSDTASQSPTFESPIGLSYDETLIFNLDVSDGELSSSSTVTVHVVAANPTNTIPVADAGLSQTVEEADFVYLDGTGSFDADGDALTYQWSQASGPSVVLSDNTVSTPSFTAPVGLENNEVLVFSLVVDDGVVSSTASEVSVTVTAAQFGGLNIAGEATASASSEANINQSAAKAIDGCIDGYPGDSTCEWVADYRAVKVGSWLELTWSSARVIDRIVFYDRPNLNDRITGLTITMSDGSSFTVGPLNNDGSASEYSFSPVEITSLRMIIDSLRGNVGLSEIEVFENVE